MRIKALQRTLNSVLQIEAVLFWHRPLEARRPRRRYSTPLNADPLGRRKNHMRYRGTINLDFTNSDANQHTRLSLALRESGWTHVETSAFTRETDDINDLWEGVGLVARQAAQVGELSAFTFHIQGATVDFQTNVNLTSTQSGPNAVAEIKGRKFPKDP